MPLKTYIAAKALIEVDGKILFIREANNHSQQLGRFDLPGGRLQPGETPQDAIKRRVREETGLEVMCQSECLHTDRIVVNSVETDPYEIILTYWRATVVRQADLQALKLSPQHDQALWVAPQAVPTLPLLQRLAEALKSLRRWGSQLALPARSPLLQLANQIRLDFDLNTLNTPTGWGEFCTAHALARAPHAALKTVLDLPYDEAGMRRFLLRETLNCPVRVHGIGQQRYMERYFLGQTDDYRVLVHRFMADDDDLGPHDHPWPWGVSVILAGSYNEIYVTNPATRATVTNHRPAGTLGLLTNTDWHRVTLPRDAAGQPIDCWTLFIHANRYPKGWGLLVDAHQEVENSFANLSQRRAYREKGLGRGRDSVYFVQKAEPQGESWWEAPNCPHGRDIRAQYGERVV